MVVPPAWDSTTADSGDEATDYENRIGSDSTIGAVTDEIIGIVEVASDAEPVGQQVIYRLVVIAFNNFPRGEKRYNEKSNKCDKGDFYNAI